MNTTTLTDPRADLVAAWLGGRVIRTQQAYRQALGHYAAWAGTDPAAAVAGLLGGGAGQANARVLGYRNSMTEAGLAPATIAQRLAALRSLVKLARTLGLVAWQIEIASPKVAPYRDTRGPGTDGVRAMLAATDDPRDRAVLRLLYDLALRRGELVALDYPADVDLRRGTVAVRGKGRHDRADMTLPEPTKRALRAWLRERGDAAGPFFLNRDRAHKGADGRLTGHSVARVVAAAAARAGIDRRVTPHGLRHASITAALDSGVGVREVLAHSRHADVRTVLMYDDRRRDDGGRIAALVAAEIE